ncbi:HIT family protein [Robiginitalea marina]|uniref:HIT family protein n=1 Tax=Robiginitalea marina TaxID=2954105 RepID=A0ABT1AWV2_9FLAO|nr:HIT family protein [Robiginitalea marina]MCO5724531.1 HIT family protein [Robiginitalea marina]
MASIFTRIINGEIPCYKIAEDEHNFAFLDINPNSIGHTLCVPKKEVDKITDLDEDAYHSLMHFSRKVALAVEQSMECRRVGFTVIGLEVPHVHVHLIPLNTMADATFQTKVSPGPEIFEATAAKIRAKLQ